jgi:hypothetical protein
MTPLSYTFRCVGPATANFFFFPYLGAFRYRGRQPSIILAATYLRYGSAILDIIENNTNQTILASVDIQASTDVVITNVPIVGKFPAREAIVFFRVSTPITSQVLISAVTFGI